MAGNLLHQLLAVKQDLEKKGQLIIQESIVTFRDKKEHFDGVVKTYEPSEDGGDIFPPEVKNIVTTVADKLRYTQQSVVDAIDARVSLEESNASGTVKADLIVGEKSFGTFSAIALLALEEWVGKVRALYHEIPTIDPTRQWEPDTTQNNVYEAPLDLKYRTVEKKVPIVLYPATDKHPAQVQLSVENVQVGVYSTRYTSGKITPAMKSDLLQRIDDLLMAIKSAKAKANQGEATQVKIGDNLFSYINEFLYLK